jgi:hypothetical protein
VEGSKEMNNRICQVCGSGHSTFLDLARHMVLEDRPNGPHQKWLERFLGVPFVNYAFGKDKAISLKLEAYWENHHSLPRYDWNDNFTKRKACPACNKPCASEKGVLLHFRQALEGWDPIWDAHKPHTNWARRMGVMDEDFITDFKKLNITLKQYFNERMTGIKQ